MDSRSALEFVHRAGDLPRCAKHARMTDPAPAWVYLLRCGDESLYCGWTTDMTRRLAAHEAGTASRYTRSRRPVTLAASFPMPDRTAARREEARVKRLSRAQKLALVARAAHPR